MIDFSNFERGFFDSKELFYPYHHTQIWTNGKLVYDSDKKRQSKKPNNNVPKNIKGDYDLSIHGNKIVLVDNKDGTTVEAKCHPDDNFDIGTGIEEAFKKLNEKREEVHKQKEEDKKIKVGDWVEVILPGRGHGLWYDWLPNDRFDLVKRFDYGKFLKKGMIGKVLYISKEKGISSETLVYFEDMEGKCHTIDLEGLKKVAKPNVC